MRVPSSLMILALLVLSCGDDSPGQVDAATCECSAAEPPIAGRMVVVDQTQIIAANGRGGQGAKCPQGGLRLSGSCTTADLNPLRDVTLEQSGFYDATDLIGWNCKFRNNEATPVTIKVTVVCLMPPSS